MRIIAYTARRADVPTTYPQTSFADSLTLVSHFLLLCDEHLDYDFHRATLRGQRTPFVAQLMDDPLFAACTFEIVPVNYEFIRGGSALLRVAKP